MHYFREWMNGSYNCNTLIDDILQHLQSLKEEFSVLFFLREYDILRRHRSKNHPWKLSRKPYSRWISCSYPIKRQRMIPPPPLHRHIRLKNLASTNNPFSYVDMVFNYLFLLCFILVLTLLLSLPNNYLYILYQFRNFLYLMWSTLTNCL